MYLKGKSILKVNMLVHLLRCVSALFIFMLTGHTVALTAVITDLDTCISVSGCDSYRSCVDNQCVVLPNADHNGKGGDIGREDVSDGSVTINMF